MKRWSHSQPQKAAAAPGGVEATKAAAMNGGNKRRLFPPHNRRHSSEGNQSSHETSVAPTSLEYEPNPKIETPPDSPSSLSTKKVWEKQLKHFMHKKHDHHHHQHVPHTKENGSMFIAPEPSSDNKSSTSSPSKHRRGRRDSSSSPKSSASDASSKQQQHGSNSGKSVFSILPGTKRLLVRNSASSKSPTLNRLSQRVAVAVGDSHATVQGLPDLSSKSKKKNGRHGRSESTPNLLQPRSASQPMLFGSRDSEPISSAVAEKLPQKPGLFHAVFARSTSDSHVRQRINSTDDELDAPLRRGITKGGRGLSSSPNSLRHVVAQNSSSNALDDSVGGHSSSLATPSSGSSPSSPKIIALHQRAAFHHSYPDSPHLEYNEDDDHHDNANGESLDQLLARADITTANSGQQLSSLAHVSSLNSMNQQQHYSLDSQHSYGRGFYAYSDQPPSSEENMRHLDDPDGDYNYVQPIPHHPFAAHHYHPYHYSGHHTDAASQSPTHSQLGLALDGPDNNSSSGQSPPSWYPHHPSYLSAHGLVSIPTLPARSSHQQHGPDDAAARVRGGLGAVLSEHEANPDEVGNGGEDSAAASHETLDEASPYHHDHHHHHQGYYPDGHPGNLGVDSDMKRAFTEFHNAQAFAMDTTSPFLGDEDPVYEYFHGGYMSRQAGFGYGSSVPHFAFSERNMRTFDYAGFSSSVPLETVDEQTLSINKSMRLLKPIEGTDSWQAGRRYLITPAALAACPISVVSTLAGPLVQTAAEAATAETPQAFGTIDLGEALITYVGEKHHLSLGKWSQCRLVLRQNILLEYDVSTPIIGLPRGFCHLECAIAYPHDEFLDTLELEFYASPCAKADHRVLMIRVQNMEDRDHWVACLNDAAQLRISDLYEYDEEREIGRGRYASVHPARRKTAAYFRRNQVEGGDKPDLPYDCALKIVDKNEFWKRVVRGKERSDTLVREPAVQSTLTVKGGKVTTFLKIKGVFETSDNFVIELELLEGTDLFDYVYSNGTLSEEVAARVLRDILVSLDTMNRIGLAHRDVKPANILMCKGKDGGPIVKIGDFGMSTFIGVDGLVRGRCGTPGYVAPEVLSTGSRLGYGNKVDVFSAGVTLYVALCGYEPFFGESEEDLIEANRKAEIDFPENDWKDISEEARQLIRAMTQPDPDDRMTAKEALNSEWIKRHVASNDEKPSKSEEEGRVGAVRDEDVPGGACCIT